MEKAFENFKIAAQKGHIIAQQFWANAIPLGRVQSKIWKRLPNGTLKAAMRGSLEAQVNLGICYSQGLGVEQNYEEAIKWFQRAAEAEHPAGKMNLAISYYEGEGVEQDKEKGGAAFNRGCPIYAGRAVLTGAML